MSKKYINIEVAKEYLYKELVKELRETSGDARDTLQWKAADAIEARDKAAEEWEMLAESWRKACKALESRIPRWIPVTERLPEKDGMYLVHGAWSASGRKVTDTCEFYVHDGYFRAAWNFDVTHWMPLPEQPKEES